MGGLSRCYALLCAVIRGSGAWNSRAWKLRHTGRNSRAMHASCGKSLWTLRVGPDSIFISDQVIHTSGVRGSLRGREEGAGLRLFSSPDICRWLLTGAVALCTLGGGAIATRVEWAHA